jgi:hypothetical protein
MEEISKLIRYNSLIDELIQKIDNDKSLFRDRDYLWALSTFIFIIIGIFLITFAIYYISSIGVSDKIIIAFAALTFIVSYGLFKKDSIEEDFIDMNYDRAVKKFNVSEDDKPFLKALIKMKSEKKEFTLSEICKISPEIFTKEKLMERLYEKS